mgnify:CR=1 FL=1
MKKTLMSLSLILIAALALTGCYDWPDPIWVDGPGATVPTITGVSSTTLLGGIENVTISGTGFGTVAEELLVYYKKGTTVGRGRTLSATDTELIVEAPAVYSDSLELWIDKRGCFEFAKYDTILTTITEGVNSAPIIAVNPLVQVAINESGNMIVAEASSKNLREYTMEDTLNVFASVVFSNAKNVDALRAKGTTVYYSLREYVCTVNDGVFVKATDRHKMNSDKEYCYDILFADNNKAYFPSNGKIYSGEADLSATGATLEDANFAFGKGNFYDGKIYMAATYLGVDTLLSSDSLKTGEKVIAAYAVNADGTLGNVEIVINWTNDFAGSTIADITFDNEDRMYVATVTQTPIYIIEPLAGAYNDGNVSLLYPVLMDEMVVSMNWDAGDYMAVITENADGARTAKRIDMTKTASPSYIP